MRLRLQNVTPVSYAEIRLSKSGDVLKNSSVLIEEGSKEEVYTEEHEKLLGTCGMTWTLFVDGYAKDGARIYDHIKGKTCHQCRQASCFSTKFFVACNPSIIYLWFYDNLCITEFLFLPQTV